MFDRMLKIMAYLASVILLCVVFSISYNIFMRYLGFSEMLAVVQFGEYSLLWITLMGSAWLLTKDKHVSVDLLFNRFGIRSRKYIKLIHSVMGIAVCGLISLYGIIVVWDHYKRHIIDIQVIDVPKYLILLIVPIGFFALVIVFIRNFFGKLKKIESREE